MKLNPKYVFLQEEKDQDYIELEQINEALFNELIKKRIYVGAAKFVGTYYSEAHNTVVVCYPKYLNNIRRAEETKRILFEASQLNSETKDCLKHMELVCKVIQSLNKKLEQANTVFAPHERKFEPINLSKYSIASFILTDYAANGLYMSQYIDYLKNAKGPIHWGKTTNRSIPYIDQGEVYYLDYIHRVRATDAGTFMTQIHSYVVIESAKLAGIQLGLGGIELPEYPQSDFADHRRVAAFIKRSMSQVFSDRDIHLFRALMAWFEQSINYRTEPIHGTHNFNLVWENVLQRVYGHNDNLPKQMPSPYLYLEEDKDGLPERRSTHLIPDIVREVGETRFVLDAKYYTPTIGMTYYDNAPGASDFSKQLSYGRQLSDVLDKKGQKKQSYYAYIIPSNPQSVKPDLYYCERGYCKRGFLKMRGAGENQSIASALDSREDDQIVYYFEMNPNRLYEDLLAGNVFTDEEMIVFKEGAEGKEQQVNVRARTE